MKPCERVRCETFPCGDVSPGAYAVPDVDLDPERITIILISEAAAPDPGGSYYAPGQPLFAQTTVQAFRDAGVAVESIADILVMGIYLTTAVKCAKTRYGIETATVKECSRLLEQELALFPFVRSYLLMGDVAIKAVNAIARRQGGGPVIPAGSTYKIRGREYRFRGARAFPSYLQAGPSFFIEKSKRAMIAEDIREALGGAAPQ
jgi:uracil-DNA glycosylase